MSILLQRTDDIRESYTETTDTLEDKVKHLELEAKDAKKEVGRLQKEPEQSEALKEDIERLEEELRKKGCDKRHCLLL